MYIFIRIYTNISQRDRDVLQGLLLHSFRLKCFYRWAARDCFVDMSNRLRRVFHFSWLLYLKIQFFTLAHLCALLGGTFMMKRSSTCLFTPFEIRNNVDSMIKSSYILNKTWSLCFDSKILYTLPFSVRINVKLMISKNYNTTLLTILHERKMYLINTNLTLLK